MVLGARMKGLFHITCLRLWEQPLSEPPDRPEGPKDRVWGERPCTLPPQGLCCRKPRKRKTGDDSICEFLWDSPNVHPWAAPVFLLFLAGLATASLCHAPVDEAQPYEYALHPRESDIWLFLLLNNIVCSKKVVNSSRARTILLFVSPVGLRSMLGTEQAVDNSSLTWFDISLVLIVNNSKLYKVAQRYKWKEKKNPSFLAIAQDNIAWKGLKHFVSLPTISLGSKAKRIMLINMVMFSCRRTGNSESCFSPSPSFLR